MYVVMLVMIKELRVMCRKFYYVHGGLDSVAYAHMCKMCFCAICAYVRGVVFGGFSAVEGCLKGVFDGV